MTRKQLEKKLEESKDNPFMHKMWEKALEYKIFKRGNAEWDNLYLVTGWFMSEKQDKQALEHRYGR